MAGIRLAGGKKTWMVHFRWEGRKCEFSTGQAAKIKAQAVAQNVEDFRKLVLRKIVPIPPNVADVPKWIATCGKDGFKQKSVSEITTIDELVTRYLAARKARIGSKVKPLSHESYRSDVTRLKSFQEFCEKKRIKLLTAFSSEPLTQYKEELITSTEGAISVHHKLRTVKALLMWAYDEELIESLPRNIRKYNDIDLPEPEPKFFTVEEVKALYEKAPPQVGLWILLGLNCGYTQSDISTLTPDMVDWDRGIITRKRSKTGVESEHKLWPITLKLLQEQSKPGPHLLTTVRGNILVRHKFRTDGSPVKTDSISKGFQKVRSAANVPLSFKYLRKTSANAIAEKFQDKPWLVELFLAHTDPRMRKHYTKQHYDDLHKAIDWLGGHFGLESTAAE